MADDAGCTAEITGAVLSIVNVPVVMPESTAPFLQAIAFTVVVAGILKAVAKVLPVVQVGVALHAGFVPLVV